MANQPTAELDPAVALLCAVNEPFRYALHAATRLVHGLVAPRLAEAYLAQAYRPTRSQAQQVKRLATAAGVRNPTPRSFRTAGERHDALRLAPFLRIL